MNVWRIGALFAGAIALAGCATAFHGSAPTSDGALYVAGESNGEAAMWKCPAQGRGACQEVAVELK